MRRNEEREARVFSLRFGRGENTMYREVEAHIL